jgi:hypothetical protein
VLEEEEDGVLNFVSFSFVSVVVLSSSSSYLDCIGDVSLNFE